eukprot:CAMPEP_0175155322 /NCGR_PEP_ID=MMETSP0087-20121206/20904_1 /TAXON_ID=136419 /ORGANISM="Unknown Unknown, Strain D1" /LENGTH=198 /DNA_ID=CAMNT_0016442451 /DNA_START=16 /DNA_END=612 /DNA_ORIENTATION=+
MRFFFSLLVLIAGAVEAEPVFSAPCQAARVIQETDAALKAAKDSFKDAWKACSKLGKTQWESDSCADKTITSDCAYLITDAYKKACADLDGSVCSVTFKGTQLKNKCVLKDSQAEYNCWPSACNSDDKAALVADELKDKCTDEAKEVDQTNCEVDFSCPLSGGAVAGIVLGSLGGVALLGGGFFCWRKKRQGGAIRLK